MPEFNLHLPMPKLLRCEVRDDGRIRVWNSDNIPIYHLSKDDEQNTKFLCNYRGNYFVSSISKDKQYGIYVDNVRTKIAIPVNELTAIYMITENTNAN